MIKCAITLGNFFPLLYGAMRDDKNGFFYKDPSKNHEEVNLLFDHLDFEDVKDVKSYHERFEQGNSENNKLIASVSKGISAGDTVSKKVMKSLANMVYYKIYKEEGDMEG